MSTKYEEVRRGVYKPKGWTLPKRKIDVKRMKEIVNKLRSVRTRTEENCDEELVTSEIHSR